MIDKIFNFFKSGNKLSDELTKIKLECNVFIKRVGNEKDEISSESILYMEIKNEKTYDYNLIIYNSDYEFSKGLFF